MTNEIPESHPFQGPWLKIIRATKHILDFSAAVDALDWHDLVRIRPYADPETGYLCAEVSLVKPFPGDVRLTAADALYNLRSALDQAMCRCAVLSGHSSDDTYFPHGKDKAGFEAALGAKCKKVPEAVRSAIATLEPYHGGNGYLIRVLHDLNLVDKHSDLIRVGTAVGCATMLGGKGMLPAGELWRRTEDRVERLPAGTLTEVNHQFKITPAVTFPDVEAIEGESALKVFAQLGKLVAETVEVIETAAGWP